jgi:hypothetical protein
MSFRILHPIYSWAGETRMAKCLAQVRIKFCWACPSQLMAHQRRCSPGMLVHRSLSPKLLLVAIYIHGASEASRVECLAQGHREAECDRAEIRTRNLPLQCPVICPYTTALPLLILSDTWKHSVSCEIRNHDHQSITPLIHVPNSPTCTSKYSVAHPPVSGERGRVRRAVHIQFTVKIFYNLKHFTVKFKYLCCK